MIPALPEVEEYRDRILAAMTHVGTYRPDVAWTAADRRRVERDVEGLRETTQQMQRFGPSRDQFEGHALRYWTDLCEVGAQYSIRWCPSGDTDCTGHWNGRCKGGTL